jgi:predicted amidohydrolase YtcJ
MAVLSFLRACPLLAVAVALFPCPCRGSSDIVLLHGRVYTGNDKLPRAEAISIKGGVIDAVGTDQEISARKDARTKVIDLEGRTVIPGIVDAHTHMWFGGLALRGFNFSTPELRITSDQPDLLVAKIKEYAAKHPQDRVLFGRAAISVSRGSTATRQLLDRAVPDRPLVIHGTAEHNMWVNTKALEMAHITDQPVADPVEEKYVVRDAAGHPTGVLIDPAMQLIARALPAEPLEARMEVLKNAASFLNSYGVTSVINATGDLAEIEAYGALRDRGLLTIRTKTAFGTVSTNHHLTPQFLADLEKARTTYHDDWVSANLIKFFADGAGATAAYFEPSADGTKAEPWYKPGDFQEIVTELDRRGYQVMTHAIGDAAAHMVLDAYEQVEKANGPRDRRLRMTHVFSLTPEDLVRLVRLSVVPDMQPLFCCSISLPHRTHRWQTLEKEGAPLAFGSDWPCTWPPDPFAAIQEAVTRQSRGPGGDVSGKAEYFLPEESVSVGQALKSYTQASAYARFSENQIGTLEAGKDADLVVLSQDLLTVPHHRIADTRAVMTMVGGRVVYEAKER